MKIKRIIALVLLFVVMSATVATASAPEVIYPGNLGNSKNIIVITNPPSDKAATFDKTYIISGYGQAGATVYLYKLSGDVYKKSEYSWTIGASNMFFKRIELERGKNALLVYASNNSGSTQNVPLEITYLGTDFQDKVNSLKVDVNSILSKK